MKKSNNFVTVDSLTSAQIAQAEAEAKEEARLAAIAAGPLGLTPEKGGYNWPTEGFGATLRVPNTKEGLNFLAEAVLHGHYNQASLEECPPEWGIREEEVSRGVYYDFFEKPALVLGVQSMGHRWGNSEFDKLWVGNIGEGIWEHAVYILREDAPVGAQAVIGSATSGSEIRLSKVSPETWELHLWVPTEADGQPYHGWYVKCIESALWCHSDLFAA